MVVYKRCSEVDPGDIFNAFQVGFSDYIIKVEMTQDFFTNRFFGPEGNSLEHSFIAFDGSQPVGVILGGIKVYEGIRTMRCGALCIHPEYRGEGVSRQLFNLHRQTALENGCRQLFLEVIAGNERAINFYKNLGYEKVYDLVYYSHKKPSTLKNPYILPYRIAQIDFVQLLELKRVTADVHINWQNDFDYIARLHGQFHYGMYAGSELIGALSINAGGKISFIWVVPELRGRRIATSLIDYAVSSIGPETLHISFPNSAGLQGFVKHLQFERDSISQYEMYLTL